MMLKILPEFLQFSPQSLVEARQRFVVGGSIHSDQVLNSPLGWITKGRGFICSNALVTSISWSIIWYTGGKYLAGLWDAILKGLGGLGLLHADFGNQIARMGETETAWVSEWATSGDSNHDNGFMVSNESDYPLDISPMEPSVDT